MSTRADSLLISRIRKRACYACEYCHMPESALGLRFQLDHIVAKQHRGPNTEDNIAWACTRCNVNKGPNLSGMDPDSKALTRLFHPRTDEWYEHFTHEGAMICGISVIGRTTAYVLAMNHPDALAVRASLIAEGLLIPPTLH